MDILELYQKKSFHCRQMLKATSTYGGIFARRSMDFYAVNILTRAPLDLEIDHDISHVLHYQTPGGTQRGDVSISQKNERGTYLLKYGPQLQENIYQQM